MPGHDWIHLECSCDTDFCNKDMLIKLKKALASAEATTPKSTCLRYKGYTCNRNRKVHTYNMKDRLAAKVKKYMLKK